MEQERTEENQKWPYPLAKACLEAAGGLPNLVPGEEGFEEILTQKEPLVSPDDFKFTEKIQEWISAICDPYDADRSSKDIFINALVDHGIITYNAELQRYLLGEQGIRLVEWAMSDGQTGAEAALAASGIITHHFHIAR